MYRFPSAFFFFFSSRRRHTRLQGDWSSDVCSSDLYLTRGGGYYFNVGCSDLIVEGEIGLMQFSDIAGFVAEGARLRTGETLAADLVVLATGYKGQEYLVAKLFGDDVAARVGPIWGFGGEQEVRKKFTRTAQPGPWVFARRFAHG